MKTKYSLSPVQLCFAFIFICLAFLSTFSQAQEAPSVITVTGEGIAKAKPDQATISVYFNDTDVDLEKSRNRVESKVSTLVSSIKPYQLKKASLDSSRINITPQYDYRNSLRTFTGYQLNRTVEFVLTDLSQLPDVMAVITKVGVSGMNSISMGLQDRNSIEKQALKLAIEHSKSLASQIAKSYGVELGKIHAVNFQQSPHFEPAPMRMAMAQESMSSNPSFAQKDLEVRANINVSFSIK